MRQLRNIPHIFCSSRLDRHVFGNQSWGSLCAHEEIGPRLVRGHLSRSENTDQQLSTQFLGRDSEKTPVAMKLEATRARHLQLAHEYRVLSSLSSGAIVFNSFLTAFRCWYPERQMVWKGGQFSECEISLLVRSFSRFLAFHSLLLYGVCVPGH